MKTFLNLRASLMARNRFIAKPRYNTLELIQKFNVKNSKMEVQSGHDVSSGLEMPVIQEVQGKGSALRKQSPFSLKSLASSSPKSVPQRRVILHQKSI